jgi:hypothetical protein
MTAREAVVAFYVPGAHLQRADAGTGYLQFSPADELRTVSAAAGVTVALIAGGSAPAGVVAAE